MIRNPGLSVAPSKERGVRFEFVDGLRGLAALAVVLPHVVGLFLYPRPSAVSELFLRLADYGRSSVEVFFVVSGFAIAYSLRDADADGFGLPRFMLRRAVRLDPPYWVGLLWAGSVSIVHARVTHQPIDAPSWQKVLAHLFYLQDILGLGQFNIVFWTLCLEFQLYLAFAVMMRLACSTGDTHRRVSAGVWAHADRFGWLLVGAFFASVLLSHTVWPLTPGWFVPYFYLFLAGSLAAWRTQDRISDGLFQICILVMGLALALRPELARVMGFLTTVVLYAAIRRDALRRWLAGRLPQWLGRISYSVYLIHAPLAVFFLGLRTRWSADSKLASLSCLVGMYLMTVALAAVLHATVEVPCLRLAQQLKRRPRAVPSPAQNAPPA